MKKTFLVAAMAIFSLSAFAQKGEKGPFATNKFFDNWFVSVGGGVNFYVGEMDSQAKFGKRLAPALDVSLGKWFTPAVGARLQYAGLSAKGATRPGAPFAGTDAAQNGYLSEKFATHFIHADFLWNVSSAIGGQRSDRLWEFIPFAGFGGAIASANDNRDLELAFTAGLHNKIRITDALSVNLEFRGMLVNQRFDGISGGSKLEGMGSATVGVTYKFNKRNFDSYAPVTAPADYTPYNNRIKALEGDLAKADERINQLINDLNAAKAAQAAAPTATEIIVPETAIFFEIDRYKLTDKELINVGYMAEAMKRMPADRKFKLIGNADSSTGSKAYNLELSRKRAQSVKDALVAAGVDASKLEVVANGDTQQPFDKPILNRVLIVE